jgi:hypothetical protein
MKYHENTGEKYTVCSESGGDRVGRERKGCLGSGKMIRSRS